MQLTRGGSLRRCSKFPGDERGFSMVEIVVVGAVMLILAAIAVPGVIRQLQAYRLDQCVATTSSKLMEARMNAIKRNQTVWLRIDKNARTEQMRASTPTGVVFDIGYPDLMPTGTNLDAPDSVEVAFDSMGRYSSGPQTVIMLENNSSKRKPITISPAGKISVGNMY